MTTLFAQPYDITANGFYFDSVEDYNENAEKNRNSAGFQVEEYELQFIDGESIDAALFKALDVNQANFGAFLDACEEWDITQKQKVIIAVGECGYSFYLQSGDPDDFDIDLYELDSLKELAEQFVDEGLFGEIPTSIQNYLDYDAIARDLGFDYSETEIAGTRLIYRCV
ncbi:MAG TPA: antirestriction protein ArdA [Alphaproteobacteria bacterium]|nr:antirestriction protein ArdA [Alphaproteobacteria bacterium]